MPWPGFTDLVNVFDLQGNPLATGLMCRIVPVNLNGARSIAERAELAAARVLRWERVGIPDHAYVVDQNGQRWNVVAGTIDIRHNLGGNETLRRCQLIRADDY